MLKRDDIEDMGYGYYTTPSSGGNMQTPLEMVQELLDKWRDVIDTTDDHTERTVAAEFVDDLHEVHKCLTRK